MPAAENPCPAMKPTTAALLTPPGRGAVATMRIGGPAATSIIADCFSPASGNDFATAAIGRIVFGHWRPSGEELVVCRRSEEEVEVHCHGGQAAVEAVLRSLADAGCEVVSWMAVVDKVSHDPIEAQALTRLARATTLRTAAILLDQYHGALSRELERCVSLLLDDKKESHQAACQKLESLTHQSGIGRHLVEPFQVVIGGKPNVGKSSLINALIGYQRSIVHDQPGTTRDIVSARTAFAGWPAELSDTAGLRGAGDALEAAGVDLAIDRLSAADLRLIVFDASQPFDDGDQALATRWPGALVVFNKVDLAFPEPRWPNGVFTSALTRQGIEELASAIGDRLVPNLPLPGAAVPFDASHERAIEMALEWCRLARHSEAAQQLNACLRRT